MEQFSCAAIVGIASIDSNSAAGLLAEGLETALLRLSAHLPGA